MNPRNDGKGRNGRSSYRPPARSGQVRPAAPAQVKVDNPAENRKPARNGFPLTMKRCRHDGGEPQLERDELGWHFVECKICHACGPMLPHAEEAITAWNERYPIQE